MKLKPYLERERIPVGNFADTIGVTVQTLYRYLSSDRFPTPENLRRIREATGGAVTADDFVDQHTAPKSAVAA